MGFKPAIRRQRLFRGAFFGPTSSGKTFTSLRLMRHILGPDQKIALIDTERGRASIYAEIGFDTLQLTNYAAQDYVAAIEEARAAGYPGLIIDSMSPAWSGEGGLLELVDVVAREMPARAGKKDSFSAWGEERVRYAQHSLWNAVLDYPGHVIITMRAKTVYEHTKDEQGKTKIHKLGLAPIQRSDVEYEFDFVCRFTIENEMYIEKATDPDDKFQGRCITKPGDDFFAEIKEWLDKGDTRIEDYRARINKRCDEIAAMTGRPIGEIRKESKQIIGNKFGTEDITTLSNSELEEIPDMLRALVPSPEVEAQTRQAIRDNKKREKEATSGAKSE